MTFNTDHISFLSIGDMPNFQLDYSSCWVLLDENTKQYCYPLIHNKLPKDHKIIEIRSGEVHKNLNTLTHIWQALIAGGADRKSLLINLGGGVIGDMGGFAAATYMRGIDFIQIPTTLLAQADASVGAKVGIDFMGYKNILGNFAQPYKVLIDTNFLKTLPREQLISGFAEVIKHLLIADAEGWNDIENQSIDALAWNSQVLRAVHIKSEIVLEDPKEQGRRKILNFGHTIGHAIESYFLEKIGKTYLHGECVAVGMICEAWISMNKIGLEAEDFKRIVRYINKHFPIIHIKKQDLEAIAVLTLLDKKNQKQQIRAVLLEQIGKPKIDVGISLSEVQQALNYYIEKSSALK
ncbi:MAG: 3-dehydroquinate synthase [Bernardetiaceae bacterium]|nr:3-dehydroquinate synthase [Bernardetiaceae bacterium]